MAHEIIKQDAKNIRSEIDEVSLYQIDKAVGSWFIEKHPFIINGQRVPVIFGVWERFSQIQDNKGDDKINSLRDKNGRIRLPIITISRSQAVVDETRYRKINTDSEPSIVFKKEIASASFDKNMRVPFNDKWKVPHLYKSDAPVYDVYRIPFPTFLNLSYTIKIYSNYVNQVNQFYDTIFRAPVTEDIEFNGYFFYSSFENANNESSYENYNGEERIIKHSFNMNVSSFIVDKEVIKVDRTPTKINIRSEVSSTFSIDQLVEKEKERQHKILDQNDDEKSGISTISLYEMDKAVYNWFNTQNPTTILGRKVPVLFGSWERFAQIQGIDQGKDPKIDQIRDKNGRIKLPLIIINRTDSETIPDRYVFKDILNQPSLVYKKVIGKSNFDKSRRIPFNQKWHNNGFYEKDNPVYKVYRLPHPEFIVANYDIIFFSNYIKHSNVFQKKIFQNRIPDDIGYNGHFFYTQFLSYNNESSQEDLAGDERVIKHRFGLSLEGYLISEQDIEVERTVSRINFAEEVLTN